jgi:predicted amidohydrolase YtcJ
MTQVTITGASVWDGTSDAAYPAAVTVEGNKIIKIRKGSAAPADVQGDVIDGSGHTLMPGLVEGHCHPSFTGVNDPWELGQLSPKSIC